MSQKQRKKKKNASHSKHTVKHSALMNCISPALTSPTPPAPRPHQRIQYYELGQNFSF